MGSWFILWAGIVCLVLSWLIRRSIRRDDRREVERIRAYIRDEG